MGLYDGLYIIYMMGLKFFNNDVSWMCCLAFTFSLQKR